MVAPSYATLSADGWTRFVAEPLLDQPSRDRIAARHEERPILGQVLRPQLLAAQPARLREFVEIDLVVERLGLGMEADHDGGGKRPRLRGAIGDVLYPHLDLFIDLARHGILETLARLDKARE